MKSFVWSLKIYRKHIDVETLNAADMSTTKLPTKQALNFVQNYIYNFYDDVIIANKIP
jgi:hypothetical protein